MFYFLNALSAQSLPQVGTLEFEKFSPEEYLDLTDLSDMPMKSRIPEEWTSAIGHQNVADYASGLLGMEIPMNRMNVQLEPGDYGIIFQYSGPRLEEGAKTLPEGAKYELIMFSVL